MMMPRRFHSALLAVSMACAGAVGAACSDPCGELERRVCESREDRKRCELMQDTERRALLSRDACEGMLKVVPET